MRHEVILVQDATVNGVDRPAGWRGHVWDAEYERLAAAGVLASAPPHQTAGEGQEPTRQITLLRDAEVFSTVRPAGWHGTVFESEYRRLAAEGAVASQVEAPPVATRTEAGQRRKAPKAIPPPQARTTAHYDEDDRTPVKPHYDEPDPP